jgi:hypothetical protein
LTSELAKRFLKIRAEPGRNCVSPPPQLKRA